MLTIYKTTPEGLETLENATNGCWIKATNPDSEEIEKLKIWGIDPELITYSLDQDEMARLERDEGYTLILLRILISRAKHTTSPTPPFPWGSLLKIISSRPFVVMKVKSPIFLPTVNIAASKPPSAIVLFFMCCWKPPHVT